jgi:TonB family protein
MRSKIPVAALGSALLAMCPMWHVASAQDAGSAARAEPRVIVDEPQPVVKVKPRYPAAAVEEGISGFVTVEFTVDNYGAVQEIDVVDSSHGLFEDAAVEAIGKWKYLPRASGGTPIDGRRLKETVEFSAADLAAAQERL